MYYCILVYIYERAEKHACTKVAAAGAIPAAIPAAMIAAHFAPVWEGEHPLADL